MPHAFSAPPSLWAPDGTDNGTKLRGSLWGINNITHAHGLERDTHFTKSSSRHRLPQPVFAEIYPRGHRPLSIPSRDLVLPSANPFLLSEEHDRSASEEFSLFSFAREGLISPSLLRDIFNGCRILDYRLFSFSTSKTWFSGCHHCWWETSYRPKSNACFPLLGCF